MQALTPFPRTRKIILALLCAQLGFSGHGYAAETSLADEPLANPLSSTKPNIMFILDDSGSMGWQYSPDYASDDDVSNNDGTVDSESDPAICFDHKDDTDGTDYAIEVTPSNSSASSSKLKTCRVGDPPFMSPDFNKQYYNPEIRYRPALTYDGITEMTNMTAANTSNWTAVPTDPYGQQRQTTLQHESSGTSTTANLVTNYPDRIWCTSKSANWGDTDDSSGSITGIANAPLCVTNSNYAHPSHVYGYGRGNDNRVKYTTGAPYYYRIAVTEYCDTQDLTNCINANADGTNPNAGSYPFPAIMRWCSNSGTSSSTDPLTATNSFASCQGKRISGFTYPKTFGRVINAANTPAQKATATISIGNSGSDAPVAIGAVIIDGVNILGSTVTASTGTNSSTERNNLASSLNSAISSVNYTASVSGNVVTITAAAAGPAPNGKTITIQEPADTPVAAKGNLQVEAVSSGQSITSITVGGTSVIAGTVSCSYSNNSTNRKNCAKAVCDAINSYTATSHYSAVTSGAGSCTTGSETIVISAPASEGGSANGRQIVESGTVNTTGDNSTKPTLSGGLPNPLAPVTTTAFSGGADAISAVPPTRIGVAPFSRINIVTGQTYPKYADRTDCVSSTNSCTYDEEMTNFANWYAYYRTRMQMMKTAAGRAFASIDDGYRVGFITINFSTTKYLKINDFTSGSGGQKDSWYTKLYARAPSSGTPLREALSRVGWLYAGQLNTGLTTGISTADDPVSESCQQNYAILSTDGYWNGNAGKKLDGTSMDNQDNDDSGWSKRVDGVYDGQQSSTSCSSSPSSCGTLADVALYYYKNDLRTGTGWDDNVQPSGRDKAQHQHMTTFTLGLGLDGYLSYRRDYDDPNLTTGDYYAITQGTKNWPAAKNDDPAALDDLWHAAVNGRGKFFSASNPSDLAIGLKDTLDTIVSVTGAGAAAATSNLQPVAGDNFAFTAEYKTVEWTGDIKARTIDLTNGNVSKVELWSARDSLNSRDWTTRNLYTFDASDTLGSGGNQLRNFCWSGASGICSDGSGLTTTEVNSYFNPTALTHYTTLSASQQAAITKEKLIDYLRGDSSNEDSGLGGITDLFRNRTSILGDIISAQPIYVKATLFDYADSATSTSDQDEGYAKFRVCTTGSADATPPTYCNTGRFPLFPEPRRGTVYVAANDGFLHAFETDVNNNPYYQTGGIGTDTTSDDSFTGNNSGNGEERWAYIPGIILPSLRTLANKPYNHKYLLDGSPAVGDICITLPCGGVDDWRTILVGGMNKGGRGYYALDITNPQAPKALWEFGSTSTCLTDTQANDGTHASDCHVGLSYGNPVITKRKSDGKWVVYVTSGFNNINPGDGKGYLYMLDAYTGKILQRISTGVGCDGVSTTSPCVAGTKDPSGLSKINGWVENSAVNNTVLAIYGADLKGNLWKFDLDPANTSTYLTAIKLAVLTDPDADGNNPQPVTTRPELAYINGYRVIFVGTGKLLGSGDLTDDQVQSVYAIRDDMSNTLIDARHDTTLQEIITNTSDSSKRTTSTNNAVNWDTGKGWHVDLPDERERVNVDPLLQLGTLTIASNVPSSDACTAGGYSYLNFFDILTGKGIDTEEGILTSIKFGGALIVGINVIQLPGGKVKAIVTTSSNQQLTEENPVPPATFTGKRVSWRELLKER